MPDTARAFVELATDYLADSCDRSQRVSTAHTASDLAARFDEPLPHDAHDVDEVLRRLREDVVPDCNHLYHPRYVGHQVSAPLPAAIWTESLTAALNNSLAVFEMSPVGTVLEHRVVRWMCDLAGYGRGSGGTMTTGGTEATFTALLAARGAALPDAWMEGVGASPPLLICGEHAHYAVTRAAGELGLGMNAVRQVGSRDGKMDPAKLLEELEGAARAGRRVMAVVATAGSTATGSFDDLQAIGSMCSDRGVWLHVDGAHGASALISPKHRVRLRGLELASSIAWDPHKMMLLPLAAGMVLVRDEATLDAAFRQRAPYLFHGQDGGRVIDQGVRSFMCSRRADVLKVWVALQRYGAAGLGALYEHLCDTARALHAAVEASPEFESLHEPESNILCFRWVGRNRSRSDTELDRFNRDLRERYNATGAGWITATNLDGRRVLRTTIMNARTTAQDVHDVLEGLTELARELERRA